MPTKNVGLCSKCQGRVPAEFFKRDGQVWIRKNCPEHGETESLVSSDEKAWQAKRDMWEYVPADPVACTLKCDKCRVDHHPNLVFLDVTNHCNMHCPICIASIRAMGFDYNPPIEYFDRIFAHISQWNPKPAVQLFGGEPTVRDDLLDIIALARKYGLRPNVTTNGVRLADEAYAKTFCEARVPTRFACDGRDADIYEKLRHNRPAFEKKMKGLENMKKYSLVKQTIISCFAWGINDQHLADLIQYCHDNRDWVSTLAIIPLAETWDPKEFKAAAHGNTLEDAERMVQEAVPEGKVEFIPAGWSYAFRVPYRFFGKVNGRPSEILLMAGVHPNCESMTILVSDGKKFRSVNHYLKVPFPKAMAELVALCRKITPRLEQLDHTKRLPRLRGQLLLVRTIMLWALRNLKLWAVADGNPPLALLKLALSPLTRRWTRWFAKDPIAARRNKRRVFRVVMLPFEEQHSVDAGRLESCKSVFTYETDKGDIQSIPACMWPPYRDVVLKVISKKWGVVDSKGRPKIPAGGNPEVAKAESLPPV
jgi:hypothetical protein